MLLAFFFLIFVVYITYRFFLTKATTSPAIKRLIPAFIVFGLLFMLVAIFSLSEWMVALSPRNLSTIYTRAELEQLSQPLDDEKIRILVVGASPSDTQPDTIAQFGLVDDIIPIKLHKNFALIRPAPSTTAVLYGYLTQNGVEAVVIYVGSQKSYFDFLDRFAIIPILTLVLSVWGGIITWIIPLRYLWKFNKYSTSV